MTKANDREYWDLIKANIPEAQIGNWVLLVEVHGEKGTRLRMETSELMTPWLAEGILNHGMEIVAQLEDDYEVDDEYAEMEDDEE